MKEFTIQLKNKVVVVDAAVELWKSIIFQHV
jgi:hypothetical protein